MQVEIQKTREQTQYDNLARLYKREIIKKECWDEMVEKGRTLTSFKTSLHVLNYPMRKRTEEELEELEHVKFIRGVELLEEDSRKLLQPKKKSNKGSESAKSTTKSETDASKTDDGRTDDGTDDGTDGGLSVAEGGKGDDEGEEEEEDGEGGDASSGPSTALRGSHGDEFGGESPLFYSQFQLGNRSQKMRQIILIKDSIYRIKTQFNETFEGAMLCKEQQIAKIKEKNKRRRKILEDLGEV